MSLKVGTRVVRGPDWKWEDQDGGEGHVGTVVTIGKQGLLNSTNEKVVAVMWDMGTKAEYRIGFDEKYDLLVYDNAAAGVADRRVRCDVCKGDNFAGMRWKCSSCHDYDLCTSCYMGNEHDTTHAFLRIISPWSSGQLLSPRAGHKRIQSKGLFTSATVTRGPDWKWQDQDGGEGHSGSILRTASWSKISRSAVAVKWEKGGAYEYRLGYDGKVDLKCAKAANGVLFYKDHLPKCGAVDTFAVGDRVAVMLEKKVFEALQKNHGGWVDGMEKFIKKVGKLAKVLPTGDIKVQYANGQNLTYNPVAVTKLPTFHAGDKVKVTSDLDKAKRLQINHGGWNSKMDKALGKEGRVLLVDADGDVKINVEDSFWTFNPDALSLLQQGSGTEGVFEQERGDLFVQLLKHLMDPLGMLDTQDLRKIIAGAQDTVEPGDFFKAVMNEDIVKVKKALGQDKGFANLSADGITPLHIACYNGNLELVDLLIKSGAKLNVKDNEGDTPIANAAHKNKPKIILFMLTKGSDPNTTNKEGGRSPLHIATTKNYTECVKVLLKGCNPNLQDNAGNTALHDAIRKGNKDTVELLVNAKQMDLKIKNKRGFNHLQHATLCDNPHSVRLMLKRERSMVDIRKDDGYTALHLAVLNSHRNIVQILITEGKCAIDIYNKQHQTPLVLAISRGKHTGIIEDLIDHGADVDSADGDGDSCLHLAAMKHRQGQTIPDTELMKKFRKRYGDNGIATPLLALMCFLVQEGASITKSNLKKHTALQYLKEVNVRKVLRHIARKRERAEAGDSTFVSIGDKGGKGGEDSGKGAGSQEEKTDGPLSPRSPRSPVEDDSFCGIHVIKEVDKEVKIGAVLGKGGFGEVCKGNWRGTPVAVKRIDTEGSSEEDVHNEVAVHRRALHPNIVQLMAVGFKTSQALIVMQLIDGKNLLEWIFKEGNPHTFEQKVRISRDVLSAVTYLHHCKILHLDIKPQNILVEKATHKPYLCDLGLAHIKTRCSMSKASVVAARGTIAYMPPEGSQLDGGGMKATTGFDIWSLACTFLEYFTGEHVWPSGMHPMAIVAKFMGTDVMPSTVSKLDKRVKPIVKQCFEKEPSRRPAAEKIMQEFSGLV